MTTRPHSFALAALAFAAVALPTLVHAADPAKTPARHQGTREELRACLDKKDDLADRTKELGPKQAEMQKELASVSSQQKAITAEQAKLNKKDAKAVAAFNAKLAELDKDIDEANAKADAYNTEQQALHKDEVSYYNSCALNTYKSWDEEAVMKERQSSSPAK